LAKLAKKIIYGLLDLMPGAEQVEVEFQWEESRNEDSRHGAYQSDAALEAENKVFVAWAKAVGGKKIKVVRP
jgi:hypothetical protein